MFNSSCIGIQEQETKTYLERLQKWQTHFFVFYRLRGWFHCFYRMVTIKYNGSKSKIAMDVQWWKSTFYYSTTNSCILYRQWLVGKDGRSGGGRDGRTTAFTTWKEACNVGTTATTSIVATLRRWDCRFTCINLERLQKWQTHFFVFYRLRGWFHCFYRMVTIKYNGSKSKIAMDVQWWKSTKKLICWIFGCLELISMASTFNHLFVTSWQLIAPTSSKVGNASPELLLTPRRVKKESIHCLDLCNNRKNI